MRLTRTLLGCLLLTAAAAARPAEEPAWTVLVDGQTLDAFKGPTADWAHVESVALDPANPKKLVSTKDGRGVVFNGPKGRARDLVTKESFGDVELHAEFLIAKGSNSGIKFHAHYEIQIFDSYGKTKELTGDDCGGIYPRAELTPTYHHLDKGIAPKVNACKPPGEWQTLDVIFTAPRLQDGKKTANARIVKATLNGELIHQDQEMTNPTGHNWQKPEKEQGPLLLQGDHGPVAFRNVKVRPYVAGKK